jgi:hypothetical protein
MVVCAGDIEEKSRTHNSETDARTTQGFPRRKPLTDNIPDLPFNMLIPHAYQSMTAIDIKRNLLLDFKMEREKIVHRFALGWLA